jgi:hypothetical protein
MNRKLFAPGGLKLDDQGHLKAAFAQLNVIDSDGDVTLPGAFPRKDVPMSAYGHTSWEGALPIGKGTISEEGDWAVFEGDFFMSTTHGHDAYVTVKGLGELAEYSYGYNVLDAERGQFKGKPANFLKSIDPFEVSPVLKGAGVGTHTIAIKSDEPGTGLPYAEEASWYLEHFPAFFERTEDREAFRRGEGRTLSKADRERLAAIAARFLEHHDAIKAFLSDPTAEAEERARRALMVEIARAKSLGVPTP